MKVVLKKTAIKVMPLGLRKRLAIWINRRSWLDPSDRAYWATQLLTDFAEREVNAYHKFLWRHHLAYAETYEVGLRFGYQNLNETRKIFFAELPERLVASGVASVAEIRSVFEFGCSLGYLLRYIETDIFPNATRLEGVDIDERAISDGRTHLQSLGSNVRLHAGDMQDVQRVLGDAKFDLVLGSGILLYLDEESAAGFVKAMLGYTNKMLVITALAHPDRDNSELEHSVPRERDGTWIHNVDRMIATAGGRVVARRWEGTHMVDGNTIYFLYATPATAG